MFVLEASVTLTVLPSTLCCMDHLHDIDSDEESFGSPSPFTRPPSVSSQTSCSDFLRSDSASPSVRSITSSILEQAFREQFGRKLNSRSEVYRLPADEEEVARLDTQHKLLRDIVRNAPCLPEILKDAVLAQNTAAPDLGCGSGAWYAIQPSQIT
ncbi:hypothetical protein B0H13DRAFT_2301402 [Mycena leptocephala]|nr:hypothetical protein B0H13DRAFT_2301402 [Mycena leptocephala]